MVGHCGQVAGLGMAMLYPNLSAAVADIAHPSWRASAIGIYRFWRDLGYGIGALGLGVAAELGGQLETGFWFVAIAMAVSGPSCITGARRRIHASIPRTDIPSSLLETTVTTRRIATALALAGMVFLPLAASAQMNKSTVEAVESYFDFIDANGGTLMSEQIPAEDYKKLFVLDVRDAASSPTDHVPGAVNIEWRRVFAERAKLPKDKTILVYCNTSSFAGQVAMALRMDGYENVRLLHGGYNEWKARGGMDAYAKASKKS